MVLDFAPDQLPWLALHPVGEWVGERLRLPKRPMGWCYRPLAWPAWNHQHRKLVRFWTAHTGAEVHLIDGPRSSGAEVGGVVAPSAEALATQLRTELTVSRRHLRETLAAYWDREWRRQHSGYGTSPQDHLWRAASAVGEMQDAVDELAGREPSG
jgi:hypothetical protein